MSDNWPTDLILPLQYLRFSFLRGRPGNGIFLAIFIIVVDVGGARIIARWATRAAVYDSNPLI